MRLQGPERLVCDGTAGGPVERARRPGSAGPRFGEAAGRQGHDVSLPSPLVAGVLNVVLSSEGSVTGHRL